MIIRDNGSIILFHPETPEERKWIDKNVQPESWQWLGNGLAVEHRYAYLLSEGMRNAGFEIKI